MRVESRESRVKSGKGVRPIAESGTMRAPALVPRLSTLDSPRGFTLTELLVVMVILAILTAMTVYAVNFSLAAERSRSAARQVQSYLEGARDRAIYAERVTPGEERAIGVRFLLDPDIANTASSMVFVEEVSPPTGSIMTSGTTATRHPDSPNPTWLELHRQRLFGSGVQIRIPADSSGFWYTIQTFNGSDVVTVAPTINLPDGIYTFKLKLPPVVRPNQEPMLLPRGIVIDLDRSRIPGFWRLANGTYVERLDVMFSPRGTLTGRAASGGLIHFYLAEAADVERVEALRAADSFPNNTNFPSEPQYIPSDTPYGTGADDDLIGDRVIVTLFPQTGAISSHAVDPTSSNGTTAVDPYRYAETGEVAGE